MFQTNTLPPSSMYFGSEHRDIVFLPIDGIDLQLTASTHRTTLSSSQLTELCVTVYNYYFSRNINFIRILEVNDDGTTQC
jgi:hypothetical protein